MQPPISQSQFRLLHQLSCEVPQEPGELDAGVREERLAWALQQLPDLDGHPENRTPAAAYHEWTATCSELGTDELQALVDETLAQALGAAEVNEPFHFSAHLCCLLLEWSHERLTRSPDPGLVRLFETASQYLAALVQHRQAVEQEASESAGP